MRVNVVAVALIVAASVIPAAAQSSRGGGFDIRALSTRADLVTGDDVLIQIVAPASAGTSAGTNLSMTVNGRDSNAEIRPTAQPNVLVARLKGLQPGKNVIEVGLKGQKPVAQLAIVNHAIAGPVISGPHQTPFFCETVPMGLGQPLDADCAVSTRVDYFYRSNAPAAAPAAAGRGGRGGQAGGGAGRAGDAAAPREVDNPNAPPPNAFKPYDPAAPKPADLMMTTTTDGRTVPYIVRREMGTINRAAYVIAFLHEPGTPLPDPWTTNTTWNQRLMYSYGGGCAAGYHQGRGFGGLSAGASDLEEAQVGLGDYPLSKGFALVAATLNVTGTSCADLISAETTMMVKEHFIETYGLPRYTIGAGGSGGSMQQHQIAANYPGLLDGIIPNRSFPDIISTVDVLTDCELMDRYFKETTVAWTPEQKNEVSGFKDFSYCANGARYPNLHAANCNQAVAKDSVYDAAANRNGARCTYQDNMVNVYGRDPKSGFARRPFDNTGVQYGLAALNAGRITVDQFLDLNAHIGGLDIDGNPSAERMVGDTEALRIAYRTGRINNGAALAGIPIIDFRSYLDGTGDVHHAVPTLQMRARLLATNGTAANQVIVTTASQGSLARDLAAQDAVFRTEQRAMFDAMDQWLAAIAADKAPAKSAGEKVIRDKPRDLVDACYTADKQKVTDAARCAQLFPYASNARMVAGEPMTGDVMKCALKPVDRRGYKQPVTDGQLASLKALFPQGVCDYSKKGVGQAPPQGTWLTYPVPDASTAAR